MALRAELEQSSRLGQGVEEKTQCPPSVPRTVFLPTQHPGPAPSHMFVTGTAATHTEPHTQHEHISQAPTLEQARWEARSL